MVTAAMFASTARTIRFPRFVRRSASRGFFPRRLAIEVAWERASGGHDLLHHRRTEGILSWNSCSGMRRRRRAWADSVSFDPTCAENIPGAIFFNEVRMGSCATQTLPTNRSTTGNHPECWRRFGILRNFPSSEVAPRSALTRWAP